MTNKIPKAVSKHMAKLGRKAQENRWSKTTEEERHQVGLALAEARRRKKALAEAEKKDLDRQAIDIVSDTMLD